LINFKSFVIAILVHFACPESKIIPNQLHDSSCIFVLIFFDVLDVCDGVIESLFGQIARFWGVVQNLKLFSLLHKSYFVAEHREVERQAQSDRVRGLQISLRDISRLFVSSVRLQRRLVVLSVLSILGNVTVVVSLHF
jgi:hypothetical protein